MKTLMVLGVREKGHPFARAIRRKPYRVIAGTEQRLLPIRPTDKHIFMESGNTEDVLREARRYAVDGILGVGDEATLTASYAAQQLELPGIPYAEEQLFHNLLRLRAFQEEHGFRIPRYQDLTHTLDIGELSYPLFVSPAEGPVLRYTERVTCPEELAAARQRALRRSPGQMVIAQEEIPEETAREGITVMTELIVRGGALQEVLWCEVLRDGMDQYVPQCVRYPARIGGITRMMLKGECAHLVELLRLQDAQIPVLAYCVPGSVPFLLRIGVRDGSYVATRFLSRLYQRDLFYETVRLAAGDKVSNRRFRAPREGTFHAYYTIPVEQAGILRHIDFDKTIRPYRKAYLDRARQSQEVDTDGNEEQTLGTVMLEFPDEETMDNVLYHMRHYVNIEVDELDRWWS